MLDQAWDQQWRKPVEYIEWSLTWLAGAMRVLREDGLLYCFGQLGKREHGFLHLMSEATRRWQFHDLITWDRVVGYNERRDSFTPATELILVLRKSLKPKFDKSAVREVYGSGTVEAICATRATKIRQRDNVIWRRGNLRQTSGASQV